MSTDETHDNEGEGDGQRVSAREILSENVRRLIDDAKVSRPQLGSILKVAEASKKLTHGSTSLSKSRVGRIATGSHPTDVDALTDLADVFGLAPWQLLVKGLNPKALPRLVDAEFLSQIRQIVDVAQAAKSEITDSSNDELQVQKAERC